MPVSLGEATSQGTTALFVFEATWGHAYTLVDATKSTQTRFYVLGHLATETEDGLCRVTTSAARHGWGPLLYDIAMAHTTDRGLALCSDRITVSSGAYRVWEYYLGRRTDVEALECPRNARHTRDKTDPVLNHAFKLRIQPEAFAEMVDLGEELLKRLGKTKGDVVVAGGRYFETRRPVY